MCSTRCFKAGAIGVGENGEFARGEVFAEGVAQDEGFGFAFAASGEIRRVGADGFFERLRDARAENVFFPNDAF